MVVGWKRLQIREMEAEFADDEDVWLPLSLIQKAIDPDLECIADEYFLEGLDKTEEGRKLLSELGGKTE